jgi:hypothetical protein
LPLEFNAVAAKHGVCWRKPAKQANISTKINPVCTSNTDRVRGVDVLALPVAGAASDKFGEFLSRSLHYGMS